MRQRASGRGRGRGKRGRGGQGGIIHNDQNSQSSTSHNIFEDDDDNDISAITFDDFDGINPNRPTIKIERRNEQKVIINNAQNSSRFTYTPDNNAQNSNRFTYTPDNNAQNSSRFTYTPDNNDKKETNSYNKNNINKPQMNPYNAKQESFKNRQIEKNGDVFRELNAKLNPKLFNVDKKIYNELDKFNKIVIYIVEKLPKSQRNNAFFLLCKVFTLDDLKNISDKNMKSSIFSIFFEGEKFKLEDIVNDINIQILMNKQTFNENDINDMFNFFKVLIDVSISNAEILQPLIDFYEKASSNNPDLNTYSEMIKTYINEKEENVTNSYESAVAPTAEDLFRSKRNIIDNHANKEWETISEYRREMIALTKENFYTPFRNSLNDMREEKLDPRDLFLYKNVQIAFTSNIKNYSAFKDCNFFLTFQIRTPTNWKRELTTPDWKYTDQLGNKSLLILSTSADLLKIDAVCKSCAVARSPNHDDANLSVLFLNKGILPVVLIAGQIKENVKYYMFEPTSCWPAVQPVLQRLLKMNDNSFPSLLLNKIIKLNFSNNFLPSTNQYKTNVLLLNDQSVPPKLFLRISAEKWPLDNFSNEQIDQLCRVDHEQYKALRYALDHNLTLVNGAPGTGKTHFAREYIRIMSHIKQKPIVIITYTNHALDAILEGVIDFFRSDEILRWGGQMRSTNPVLKERKWKNFYLSKSIRNQKNDIVTLKQHLKNMYNIRQMAYICIKAIPKNPQDLKIYQKIIELLNNFFDASKRMASHYPINFSPKELSDYMRYLRIRDGRINYTSLPDENSALICWLNGEQFYEKRNSNYREILNYNRKIVDGDTYVNRFNFLNNRNDDDDYNDIEEEEDEDDDDDNENEVKIQKKPNPDDINFNSSEKTSSPIDNDNDNDNSNESENNNNNVIEYDDDDDDDDDDIDENEEEEEEDVNDKKYNDADIIELTRVTFDGSEISENLPSKYLTEFLIDKFDILFEVKNPDNRKTPDKLMIEYLKEISDPLTQMIEKFEDYLQKNEIIINENETKEAGKYLSRMRLIGMTSTVASLRKEALEVAGCEIMLVEEAGELTESMISCILPKTLKRLILIGDYQQLRPKVEHELTKEPFHYDISLFEKLVVNAKKQNADCLFTLSVQRRMHPQISSLIRNAFYSSGEEKITDAISTGSLGIPFGIPYRVRFIMHDYEENKVATRSHVNVQEAKYCASLVPFFICRGYKPEDITIISLYKGQKFQIEREIESLYNKCQKKDSSNLYDPFGKIKNPRKIKVVVLDNFQGEENKVIIVSLTRSNKPGFVKNRNRALVTLSRAREMLVVLGHERIFGSKCKNNDQWRNISKVATKLNSFSMSNPKEKGLAVNKCFIHKANSAHIPSFLETPEQVFKYRFSFCQEKCNFELSCGHRCQLVCHCHNYPPDPSEHADYYCPFRCQKKCVNGHQCSGNCGQCTHNQRCPLCRVKIHHVFKKCHHEADIDCYLVTSGKAICYADCGKILTRCGHLCKLQCGHLGPCNCKVQLKKECENCGKTINYMCGDVNIICHNICNHVLKCGHTCMSECHICSERGFHDQVCSHDCDFVFPCGHKCQKKCSEKFPLHQHYYCTQHLYINHNFCGNHSLNPQMLIRECTNQFTCNYPCQHFCTQCRRKCNHRCDEKCVERCRCRCPITCFICGKRCRCLTGERCAIFCPHFQAFRDIKEPPESDGILYVFHDNHFMTLNEAIRKVTIQYEAIMNGKGDLPVPIQRLTCPCDGCQLKDPCIIGSWLFDHFNKNIEKELGKIRVNSDKIISRISARKENNSVDKINWFVCQKCKNVFPIKFDDPKNIEVKCSKCGFSKKIKQINK